MKKFAIFLIFIGLVLVGISCYQKFVGDIPFVDNLFEDGSFVTGRSIGVEKIDTIDYKLVVGEEYNFDVEEFDDNVNKSFSLNIVLNKEVYKFSFNYPDYLTLSSANYDKISFSGDNLSININYFGVIPYEDRIAITNDTSLKNIYSHYNIKSFSAKKNSVGKIYLYNSCFENEKYFINRAGFSIYDKTEKETLLGIEIIANNKKIPDTLLANIYNSFKFEKTDDDFNFCDEKNDKYVCSFNLSNYGLSSDKEISVEFPSNLYDFRNVHNSLPRIMASDFHIKTKDSPFPILVHFEVEYNALQNKEYLERSRYVEETIDGRTFMVKRFANDPVNTFYVYEVEPNVFVNISTNSVEEGFEEDEKEFGRTDFKIEDLDQELFDTIKKTFLNFKVN